MVGQYADISKFVSVARRTNTRDEISFPASDPLLDITNSHQAQLNIGCGNAFHF